MILKVFESLAIISLTEKYPALSSTNIKHESNLLQILQFKRPSELLEVLWPKKKPGLSYSKKKVKQE
jgi:hypothetical protein